MYQENADESGQSEDWRKTLLMGVGDLQDQPSYHKDVERENLPELAEQETTAEPVQENPSEQSSNGNGQQEGQQEGSGYAKHGRPRHFCAIQ